MSVIDSLALSLRRLLHLRTAPTQFDDEQPLRAELFSAGQMAEHGQRLARAHVVGKTRGPDLLLPRLARNESTIEHAVKLLAEALKADRRVTPAGEWLLDNYYLIDEQIRTTRRHLPERYSTALPRLIEGASAGLPRVYDIALEAISHGDGRVDAASLGLFIAAYQKVADLTLGELWAVPIMLRLALIENLRRIATRIATDRRSRNLADYWAEQMIGMARHDPKNLILVIADMARSQPPMESAFVAELTRKLQGQGNALALPLTWIELHLSEIGLTTEQLVQAENQKQAADQIAISNSIGSMRFLASMEWRDFVESMSATERVLREDPAGAYAQMNFATRDRYRHVVEDLALRAHLAEHEVARRAIALATAVAQVDPQDRRTHVGFFLIDDGLPALERQVGAKWSLRSLRSGTRSLAPLYFGAIAAIALAAAVAATLYAHYSAIRGWALAGLNVALVIGVSQLAVALINRITTLFLTPNALPGMDFSGGIPDDFRTLVVVPTMFGDIADVDALVESLEVRFLANRDASLRYALLTDFTDAHAQTLPADAQILQRAGAAIEHLNTQYADAKGDIFFLLHRPRRWNARERVWMGQERKRGKLADLNALLCRNCADGFALIVGDASRLSGVRYVITLDTDTQLPRDSARNMVAAMAHPLNRAQYSPDHECIWVGYAILQPRVEATLVSANRSRFARLQAGDAGIDPYTRAVSDVYQDAFGEGSFTGKGIYDVAAFEQILDNRFPQNRILSHDLLEGCYARSGLLSSVEMYEDQPSRYLADAARRHRWIRGDWQIASWMFSRVPGPEGARRRNPLTLLSQWKILDNLRRSLVPGALMLLFLVAWFALPQAIFWSAIALGIFLLPPATAMLLDLLRTSRDIGWRQHVRIVATAAARRFAQALFQLACLPHEAYLSLDAIVRTHVRIAFTRRHMLQWTPSSEVERKKDDSLLAAFRAMWVGPTLALACAGWLGVERSEVFVVVCPVLLAWLVSPWLAWWLSRPLDDPRAATLGKAQVRFLRKAARRTWAFFDELAGPDEHWLPPDNIQEKPAEVIARRTSPTNIGMALLSNLSAHDLGYISTTTLLERCRNLLATMQLLPRERGHFYNWYDTRTLQPLHPLYISTVDSGNLGAHLLTLHAGLLHLQRKPVLDARMFEGLRDVLELLRELAGANADNAVDRFERHLDGVLPDELLSATDADCALVHLVECATEIREWTQRIEDAALERWANALLQQCRDAQVYLRGILPWLAMPPPSRRIADIVCALPIPVLEDAAAHMRDVLRSLRALDQANADESAWIDAFAHQLASGAERANATIADLHATGLHACELAQMDFRFLYDSIRRLFAIGYDASERRMDQSFYDLLASEARLASYLAIAQDQTPQEHWYAMGRLLAQTPSGAALYSWSGSMFEYLMPLLVMPSYRNSLLDRSCAVAVARQIAYANERGVPWGISESGYSAVDAALNYQYRAFGVPGLGLKRGLAEDLVIAPYASALALLIDPASACANLQRLAAQDMLGRFGFYEAVDYTPSRLHRGETSAKVVSFMAHHQGMSLLAFAHALLDAPMQRRFVSAPLFQSALHLLQERIPKADANSTAHTEMVDVRPPTETAEMPIRVFGRADTPNLGVQLLSNGRYHVMLTNSGGGYSRWKDLAVTRWREDPTCDDWGTFCYVRDLGSAHVWSIAYQPTRMPADVYEATFAESRVEYRRRDNLVDTHTDVAVSPEHDIELRRVRLINRSRTPRTIELTSYAEVVLALPQADAGQRGFNNLFVQTRIQSRSDAIVCTRRPRSADERPPWMLHVMKVRGGRSVQTSFETDRAAFIGRGRTLAAPAALDESAQLSGAEGSVLDACVAIRQRVVLQPDQTVTLDIVTGVAEDETACLGLIERYQDKAMSDRVFDLAWTHSHVALSQINVGEADAQLFGRLAGTILYANAALRADAQTIAANRCSQPGLWSYAISGDLPIVLLKIRSVINLELARQLVRAHAYWRMKGLAVDLVIWNDDRGGYRQVLHDEIMGLISAGIEPNIMDRPGGIFVRQADQISPEDRGLLMATARVIVDDDRGSLLEQVKRREQIAVSMPRFAVSRSEVAQVASPDSDNSPSAIQAQTQLFNGFGGFSTDGTEFVISVDADRPTPLPWVNILANPQFGSVVSERGSAYTWAENAHEFRLSPWHDDPVCDPTGEAFYLRDEETGQFWSPQPAPACGTTPYRVRHGFGYSVFEHEQNGIHSELWVYVALDMPVKFCVLRVRNVSAAVRRLSATGYIEWVLGDLRTKSAMHVVGEIDTESGALLARNAFNEEFSSRVAFFDVDDPTRTITGDRTEFIGRNGLLGSPAALQRSRLSGRIGAGTDPCAAIQVPFELGIGKSRELIFRIGAGRDAREAGNLILRCRKSGTARDALDAIRAHWQQTLGKVQIHTPDPALNILANGWLLYQTIASRIWARSGYAQSGGAWGFRDQLQDAMALVHCAPQMLRAQVLLCASRQFRQGDVQHWWHPPSGRGVRTRCSDDYLWLPLAVARYIQCSGDVAVLEQRSAFLEGRVLNENEESWYDLPSISGETASLYEHCQRAITHGLRFGARGLPLMGSGDWNDGMNNVGIHGKGESVWLGFFLYDVLMRFADVAERVDDAAFAEHCRSNAQRLRGSIDKNAWDGQWYRRAYFDDGKALGAAANIECRIDSIAQSWSVLSAAGDPKRRVQAMAALDQHLVRRDHALVQLLEPPFDVAPMDPGYIKGYVPGVRENGGQYTHAAVWAAMAFAELGDAARANELLNMINPLRHGDTVQKIGVYKTEPYVIAADIYAVAPHTGRGGWTWYTGSAGWMYRLIVESILGLRRRADKLEFSPCLPAQWPSVGIDYRHGAASYRIQLRQADGVREQTQVWVDGSLQTQAWLELIDDAAEHDVIVEAAAH
ncbi:MAG TPA: glucoamylase family protein [Rudaea sp.]|nr:glucoamylase family protein [Rudaea sp.]